VLGIFILAWVGINCFLRHCWLKQMLAL